MIKFNYLKAVKKLLIQIIKENEKLPVHWLASRLLKPEHHRNSIVVISRLGVTRKRRSLSCHSLDRDTIYCKRKMHDSYFHPKQLDGTLFLDFCK